MREIVLQVSQTIEVAGGRNRPVRVSRGRRNGSQNRVLLCQIVPDLKKLLLPRVTDSSTPAGRQVVGAFQQVMDLLRISKRRLYELAERDDDPLPLRTFPGAKRGSIADRRELRDWVLRNTVLVREREQRG